MQIRVDNLTTVWRWWDSKDAKMKWTFPQLKLQEGVKRKQKASAFMIVCIFAEMISPVLLFVSCFKDTLAYWHSLFRHSTSGPSGQVKTQPLKPKKPQKASCLESDPHTKTAQTQQRTKKRQSKNKFPWRCCSFPESKSFFSFEKVQKFVGFFDSAWQQRVSCSNLPPKPWRTTMHGTERWRWGMLMEGSSIWICFQN